MLMFFILMSTLDARAVDLMSKLGTLFGSDAGKCALSIALVSEVLLSKIS